MVQCALKQSVLLNYPMLLCCAVVGSQLLNIGSSGGNHCLKITDRNARVALVRKKMEFCISNAFFCVLLGSCEIHTLKSSVLPVCASGDLDIVTSVSIPKFVQLSSYTHPISWDCAVHDLVIMVRDRVVQDTFEDDRANNTSQAKCG